MIQFAKYHAHDGITRWQAPGIGLAHLAFHTTPEACKETQPFYHATPPFYVIADARLDNRAELLSLLKLGEDTTDVALIAAAYAQWGEMCPQKLIGNYAVIIWDVERRKVVAFRDALGMRLLHYARVGNSLLMATAVGSIRDALPTPPDYNQPLLQGLINRQFDRCIHETAYKDIYLIPAGYIFTATADRTDWQRYWTLGQQAAPHYRRQSDYIEHCRHLLADIIAAQLRCQTPVSLLVSGGVDSSAVAGHAYDLQQRGVVNTPLELHSAIFTTTPAANEQNYLNDLLKAYPELPFFPINGDQCWSLSNIKNFADYPNDTPDVTLIEHQIRHANLQRMRQNGSRVVLDGNYGDKLFNAGAYHYPHLLQDLPLSKRATEKPYFTQYYDPNQQLSWWWHRWRPIILSETLIEALIMWQQSVWPTDHHVTPAQSVPNQTYRRHWYPDSIPASNYTAHQSLIHHYNGLHHIKALMINTLHAYFGVQIRSPFSDRRLVDFILTVPPQLIWQQGLSRYILRLSLTGLVPDSILKRTTKAGFSPLFHRGFMEKERDIVEKWLLDSKLSSQQLVSPQRWHQMWQKYWSGDSQQLKRLIWPLAVDLWLRRQ
ncbi:MAG TPA: asparagine synthase-related protein [Anaerolineae bacterium]|nr:asparagine synthase-related protein [Anaerolineae bacterium]